MVNLSHAFSIKVSVRFQRASVPSGYLSGPLTIHSILRAAIYAGGIGYT